MSCQIGLNWTNNQILISGRNVTSQYRRLVTSIRSGSQLEKKE